ncbi:MAG TPA: hypothetical protein VKA08_16915 [Balneolales bacterium]|jgi:hypothetical protein|nr:hypothetical protein [Balneolales bacterium]
MDCDKKFTLITGTFSAGDAKEILMSLIGSKITFHTIRNLSKRERDGTVDSHSVTRINELTETRKHILDLLEKMGKENRSINISSDIHIYVDE